MIIVEFLRALGEKRAELKTRTSFTLDITLGEICLIDGNRFNSGRRR
jgi:hypothetical protein